MSNTTNRFLNIIRKTSASVNMATTKIVTLKVKTLSPLTFLYNEKSIITQELYTKDKNFSEENLEVGDSVTALLTNNNQTFYLMANKTYESGQTGDYNQLENKPKINGITLSGNKTTSDLGINVPTKISDLINDSDFVEDASYVHTDNNFTNSEKTKLNSVASGAQVNKIETIKVNGTAQSIINKIVDIDVPTKTSDLTNDNNFISDANYIHTDNNYTTAEKNKLSGIALGADVNKIEKIKVNGTEQTITSKAVDIAVPTNNNQLTNGAGYQTAAQVTAAITEAIENIDTIQLIEEDKNIWRLNFGIYEVKAYDTSLKLYYSLDSYIEVSSYESGFLFVQDMFAGSVVPYTLIQYTTCYYGLASSDSNLATKHYLEKSTNKVTSVDSSSTNDQYPSAKLLYDYAQEKLTSTNKLSSDLVDDSNNTNKFVTSSEKTDWNAKYDKPSTGIPESDLASAVQTSLEKAQNLNIAYGTCSTGATTAEKAITLVNNDDWELKVGSLVMVKYDITNTANNPTLNVNNTGAKSVWYNKDLVETSNLSYAGYADRPSLYMYDGTNYVWISHSTDNNTTYTNASLGQGYGTCTTAAATQEKAVTLGSYTLTVGGFVAVKFTYSVGANATMNIRTRGAKPIFCNGSAIKNGMIQSNDTAFFIYDGTNYNLLGTVRSFMNSTPVTLYSGVSVEADVTLTETSANFKYIEILFGEAYSANNIIHSSIKIENPNGKAVSLSITSVDSGNYYNISATYDISGTTLSIRSFGTLTVNSSGVSSFDSSEDNIAIFKVLGYRKS